MKAIEEPVTWKALLFLLASFGAFVLASLSFSVSRAEAQSTRAAQMAKDEVLTLAAKVDFNKREADAGMAEVRKDVQAIYQYLLTKQRQPRLERQ